RKSLKEPGCDQKLHRRRQHAEEAGGEIEAEASEENRPPPEGIGQRPLQQLRKGETENEDADDQLRACGSRLIFAAEVRQGRERHVDRQWGDRDQRGEEHGHQSGIGSGSHVARPGTKYRRSEWRRRLMSGRSAATEMVGGETVDICSPRRGNGLNEHRLISVEWSRVTRKVGRARM